MTGLESWLARASRGLSKDSAARVRAEIQEHFEAAREAAMRDGVAVEEAEGAALAALGDAKAANRQYRRVLLTAEEARMLSACNWEARVVCAHSWVKWVPVVALLAATAFLFAGATDVARMLFIAAAGMGVLFTASFLPVYTPSRARIFRVVKWAILSGAFVLAFGEDALKFSWLLLSCMWPLVWIEWTRASIRRKLRVEDWPKQLYL